MGKNIHILPHPGGWSTKREGATRVGAVYHTKSDAIAHGRQQAQSLRSELKVHNKNGQIAYGNSYGNDPFPPRG